ncbi:hypothetical protein R6Q57_021368 [Mikania cordata]
MRGRPQEGPCEGVWSLRLSPFTQVLIPSWFEFTTGSNKPVPLTEDPIVTELNDSNSSEVCAESVSVSESDPSPLTEQLTQSHSTVTPKLGSKLNPNSEPYVPTGPLEQASTSSIFGLSDCEVKTFDPKEFHDKVCRYAWGRPRHIARHCLHRPTEFFYG